MRRNTGLDATSATPEPSKLPISAFHVHNLLQEIKVHASFSHIFQRALDTLEISAEEVVMI
jgi:hypothetical protein